MFAETVRVGLVATIALAVLALDFRAPKHAAPAPAPAPAAVPALEVDGVRGPYADLSEALPSSEMDIQVAQGVKPFDEYTVLITTAKGGLGDETHYTLAMRVGASWWLHELGFAGSFCTAQLWPVHTEIDADAPHQHGDVLDVHVVERMFQHDRKWASERTVSCQVVGDRPHCA